MENSKIGLSKITFHIVFKSGLVRWAKQIENGVYLINGQVKDEDCDLLEGQVSSERILFMK